MVINFKARGVSRGARKLAQTSMLIKKILYKRRITSKQFGPRSGSLVRNQIDQFHPVMIIMVSIGIH
jgi:hypothetical protein